jgi:hypothetical protein
MGNTLEAVATTWLVKAWAVEIVFLISGGSWQIRSGRRGYYPN